MQTHSELSPKKSCARNEPGDQGRQLVRMEATACQTLKPLTEPFARQSHFILRNTKLRISVGPCLKIGPTKRFLPRAEDFRDPTGSSKLPSPSASQHHLYLYSAFDSADRLL
jgi:hypothetical protein